MIEHANRIPLIVAVALLALALHLRRGDGSGRDGHQRTVFTWLLLALFPSMLLIACFPDIIAQGQFRGIKLGGVAALFVTVWTYGSWAATRARTKDEQALELNRREEELRELKQQLEASTLRRRPLSASREHYEIEGTRCSLGIITGSIHEVRNVDVWVNSENTDMQMASFYDRSVSGTVRLYGARCDAVGKPVDDVIARELAAEMKRFGGLTVPAASVLVTGPGELARFGVKRVFHVACVHGARGAGYQQVANLRVCVSNVLERMDQESSAHATLRSVVIPLLGTGQARGDIAPSVRDLVEAAVSYLRANPTSRLEAVYFAAYTQSDLEHCRQALRTVAKPGVVTAAA